VKIFLVPRQIIASCGGDTSSVAGTHLVVLLPLVSVQEQCLLPKCGKLCAIWITRFSGFLQVVRGDNAHRLFCSREPWPWSAIKICSRVCDPLFIAPSPHARSCLLLCFTIWLPKTPAVPCCTVPKATKLAINLNKTYKQISYLTVNTLHPYYKGKSLSAIYEQKITRYFEKHERKLGRTRGRCQS
jgi:hypothetical protein